MSLMALSRKPSRVRRSFRYIAGSVSAAAQFDVMNKKLTDASIQAQIYSGTVGPVMNVLNNVSFALIAAVGGYMAFKDFTTVGVVVAFLNYSKQFQRPLNDLANQFNLVQSAVAGAERVFEVIDTESEYQDNLDKNTTGDMYGEVHFERVSFSYKEGVLILKDVSLPPGRARRLRSSARQVPAKPPSSIC